MIRFQTFQEKLKHLKRETYTLYFVLRHPRTPWYAKVFVALIVAYAVSPIDLIPDFIPVLGYLDDLVLIPLGVWLVIKIIPADVMRECRAQARVASATTQRLARIGSTMVIGIWAVALVLVCLWLAGAL